MKKAYTNYSEESIFTKKGANEVTHYRTEDDSKKRTVHQYKLILVGDGGVGKTSIFGKFMSNTFSCVPSCTLKIEAKVKSIEIDKENVVDLQVWDTCGQEKYKTVTRSYYRNNHGCIIVFDITNKDSFKSVINWYNDLKEYGQKDQIIILVGNKKDLSPDRQVCLMEIDVLITKFDLTYIEVSAKSGENVPYLFEYMSLKFLYKDDHLKKIPEYSNNYTTSNLMRNSLTINQSIHTVAYDKKMQKLRKQRCCV